MRQSWRTHATVSLLGVAQGGPPIDALVRSSECLDPTVEAVLADALIDAALPAPERGRIAAALGALDCPNPDVAGALDVGLDALRGGRSAATELVALRIDAGAVSSPVYDWTLDGSRSKSRHVDLGFGTLEPGSGGIEADLRAEVRLSRLGIRA